MVRDPGPKIYSLRDWSNWEQRFAWLPKQIDIKESVSSGAIKFWQTKTTKRIWLRHYWVRSRVELYYVKGRTQYEYDYALDVFDLMVKQ